MWKDGYHVEARKHVVVNHIKHPSSHVTIRPGAYLYTESSGDSQRKLSYDPEKPALAVDLRVLAGDMESWRTQPG